MYVEAPLRTNVFTLSLQLRDSPSFCKCTHSRALFIATSFELQLCSALCLVSLLLALVVCEDLLSVLSVVAYDLLAMVSVPNGLTSRQEEPSLSPLCIH